MTFNNQLLKLRDKKSDLIEEINKMIDRIEQIKYLLSIPFETSDSTESSSLIANTRSFKNTSSLNFSTQINPSRPCLRNEEVPEK